MILRLEMASTSNAIHGADAEPDNSTFDLDHGLTTCTTLRRDVPRIYKYLADLKRNSPSSPNSVDSNRVYRAPEFEGWVSGGQEDTNSVPMQLLNLPKQEENDLLLVYPNAKVQANCITTEQYIFVVKRFMFWCTMKGNCMAAVPHPQAYARLLRRLSRELRCAPLSGFKSAYSSDPSDYHKCLGEMLHDIEETGERDGEILKANEETSGLDKYVYVRRGTDIYVRCLIAAATELSSC